MDQNCKLWVPSICPLAHNFERFFKYQDVKTYGSINYGKMQILKAMYVRICFDPLARPQVGNLCPFWVQKMVFLDNFYKNYVIYLGTGTCLI